MEQVRDKEVQDMVPVFKKLKTQLRKKDTCLKTKKKVAIQSINDIAKRRKVSKRKSENLNMPKRKSRVDAGWGGSGALSCPPALLKECALSEKHCYNISMPP